MAALVLISACAKSTELCLSLLEMTWKPTPRRRGLPSRKHLLAFRSDRISGRQCLFFRVLFQGPARCNVRLRSLRFTAAETTSHDFHCDVGISTQLCSPALNFLHRHSSLRKNYTLPEHEPRTGRINLVSIFFLPALPIETKKDLYSLQREPCVQPNYRIDVGAVG